MADRDINLRLSIDNAERAIRDLRQFGDRGDRALKRIETSSRGASRGLASVNTAAIALGNTAPQLGAALATLGTGIAGVAVAGIAALAGGLALGVRNSEQAEQSFLRLEGVIKATGGSAGLTVEQIDELANSLERTTLATSEGINDAAAALATFRSISGETFERTIELGADSAAVFGGNLTSNVVRFGKALEDPVRGLSQLREANISFTAAQEDVIRSLVETGEKAEAQRVILEALEAQIGGSGQAEASGLTGAWSLLRAELGDALQDFGEVTGAAGFLNDALRGVAGAVADLRELVAGDPLGQVQSQISELETQLANPVSSNLFASAEGREQERNRIRERIAALQDEENAIRRGIAATTAKEALAAVTGRRLAEQAEEERRLAAEREAAAEAEEKAASEREKAAQAAQRAAERRAEAIRTAIASVAVEVDQQQRLREALTESQAAYDAVADKIEIENELRAVGLRLTSAEGQQLAELISLRQDEADALEQTRATRERLAQIEDDRLRRQEDRGFDPAQQNRDMAARAAEAERAAQRERDAAIQRQTAALEGAVDRIGESVSNIIRDFRLGLIDGGEDFARSIADALAAVPEQLAGTLFTGLFDGLIDDFSQSLRSAAGPGGDLDLAGILGAFNNPLGAATLGAFAGSTAANQFGIGGQFSGLGGGIGAGAGFLLGGPAGGVAGGLLGSLVGGLFSPGEERNNQGVRVSLQTGGIDLIGNRNENTQAAQQVGQQLAGLLDGLRSAGITFENGNIRFNVNNGRSPERALAGAVGDVRRVASSDNAFVSAALTGSRATTAQGLLSDIEFAQSFEQLVSAVTPAEVALRQLNAQFDEAAQRARQLGLEEAGLAESRERATEELVRASEDQLRGAADALAGVFEQRIAPLQGSLNQLTFGAGSALGVQEQLGLATAEFDLLTGRARAGEEVDFTRLASLGTQVVGLARELDASGAIFQSTFSDVDTTLRELVAEQTAQQDDLLSAFNELQLGQRDQTAELSNRLDRLIDEFSTLTRTVELQGRVA